MIAVYRSFAAYHRQLLTSAASAAGDAQKEAVELKKKVIELQNVQSIINGEYNVL